MNLKDHFSRFYAEDPQRLHFAAHSHHPWPDVSQAAHEQYWADSARLVDDKWGHIFGTVLPETRQRVADVLGVTEPHSLTFAPNTHEFVLRLFSCFEPPVRILSTGSEFHSFARQSRRWEEAGLAIVDRIPTEPFDDFEDRFGAYVEAGVHDMVFLSSVFFDSGYVVAGIERLVAATPNDSTFFVIDGYHQFMALPTDLGAIENRAFFLAGGYKYAMAGEGVCFLHSPSGFGARPVNTGWYAGFGHLESGTSGDVPYNDDGTRFAGATYDASGIYRLGAILNWLADLGVTPASIHDHVSALQQQFLASQPQLGELTPRDGLDRGNFLTFRSDTAGQLYQSLHDAGAITDYRGDRLRIGFGIYQDQNDVERLVDVIKTLGL